MSFGDRSKTSGFPSKVLQGLLNVSPATEGKELLLKSHSPSIGSRKTLLNFKIGC